MNLLILGNTKRTSVLAGRLIEDGFNVDELHSIKQYNENKIYDYVVLPIPTKNAKEKLNLDLECNITPDNFLKKIQGNPLIVSCNYSNPNHNIIDLNKREDFTYLNAIPTAEGAISIAIESSEKSISQSKIAVLGFGHVGKTLSKKLIDLGCAVTIMARSNKDIFLGKALGFKMVNIANIKDQISNYDIIFQTIPTLILDKDILDNVNHDSIIIELSSRAVGTDMAHAKTNDINVIFAPALPEKTAPITAGNILYECVKNIIYEQNKGV